MCCSNVTYIMIYAITVGQLHEPGNKAAQELRCSQQQSIIISTSAAASPCQHCQHQKPPCAILQPAWPSKVSLMALYGPTCRGIASCRYPTASRTPTTAKCLGCSKSLGESGWKGLRKEGRPQCPCLPITPIILRRMKPY